MKKKILLTGATGDVGSQAVKILAERTDIYDVRIFIRKSRKNEKFARKVDKKIEIVWGDITNEGDVKEAVKGIDAIIHTAAVIPPFADKYPDIARKTNIEGTRNIVESFSAENPSGLFIFTSSISVYGDRVEDYMISVDDPLEPSMGDYYGVTKVEAEKIIRSSSLRWIIFRLTYITTPVRDMGLGSLELMFHMPLDTKIEILESDDTAYALVQALEADSLIKRIHNLGGGESCRTTFREYIDRYFSYYGLGKGLLPEESFAKRNFHCGFYTDTKEVQEALGFQRSSLEDHFKGVVSHVNPIVKILAALSRPLVRLLLVQVSEPYKIYKGKTTHNKERFFGKEA